MNSKIPQPTLGLLQCDTEQYRIPDRGEVDYRGNSSLSLVDLDSWTRFLEEVA